MKNGFSLVELVIAIFLSLIVLVAVLGVATMMVRTKYESMRRGEVTADTLYNMAQMHREISDSTYIYVDSSGLWFTGCHNYSQQIQPFQSGQLNPSQPIMAYYYCLNGNNLLRYQQSSSSCPFLPKPVCGAGGFRRISGFQEILAQPSYPKIFTPAYNGNGIEIHFSIGNPASTPTSPIPVMYNYDAILRARKPYNSIADTYP